jgi:SRSO17 transposase
MVDGELFLPEEWFGEDFADLRQELGIPEERHFETKIELGLKMVKRAKANGLPFDLLACDTLYGRASQFRAALETENVLYAAAVPANTHVYLNEPRVGVPEKRHKRGRTPTRPRVLSLHVAHEVRGPWRAVATLRGSGCRCAIPNAGCWKLISPCGVSGLSPRVSNHVLSGWSFAAKRMAIVRTRS